MAEHITLPSEIYKKLKDIYVFWQNSVDNKTLIAKEFFDSLSHLLEETDVHRNTVGPSKDRIDENTIWYSSNVNSLLKFHLKLKDLIEKGPYIIKNSDLSLVKLHKLKAEIESLQLFSHSQPLTKNHTGDKRIIGLIQQLEKNQNEIVTRVKDANSEVRNATDSGISQISRHYNKHTNNLENKSKELLSSSISELESKTADSVSYLKEQSIKLQHDLTEEVKKRVERELASAILQMDNREEEINGGLDRTLVHAKNQADEVIAHTRGLVSELDNKVSEQVDEFVKLNNSLRKTLSFVASDALADSSIKQAQEERKTADSLRLYGVIWLIASIGLFLLTFDYEALIDKEGTPQYTLIFLRSFFLIVGITPGFYLLRESARHRTDERRYRQKGIQLATIDGYFSEFESEQRNTVKRDLCKHYFHGDDHYVDSSSVDNVQSTYSKVFDSVLSNANKKTVKR
ncbi:hypothetical protein INR79_05375 [Vibrio sp. SCSIO 43132]|uniref:hypothetical protein n=1 Tax=Vibrio sp. SCSIO 43132 TaxID=2779363 RepID=UPI001CA9ACD4|nr:hypothetical protein [Vibrio sp. SCSIO 43132]UAB71339.1 hypothetical protein INR79_05375 [Vibrio sp. SCSIO 43132]